MNLTKIFRMMRAYGTSLFRPIRVTALPDPASTEVLRESHYHEARGPSHYLILLRLRSYHLDQPPMDKAYPE